MTKVFNASHFCFRLEAYDGEKLKIPAGAFANVPDKFCGDITYRRAVKANELQVFETVKQADNLQKTAEETVEVLPFEDEPVAEQKPTRKKKAVDNK